MARPRQDQDRSSQDQDQDHSSQDQDQDRSSQDQDQDQNAHTSDDIYCHHHRLRHAYVTKYSTNYRRHLMFMAKLLNKLLPAVNESTDANVPTKQHCISQTPSHTIHH